MSKHLCYLCKNKDICKYRDKIRTVLKDKEMQKVFAHNITLAITNCSYYIEDGSGDIYFEDYDKPLTHFTPYEEYDEYLYDEQEFDEDLGETVYSNQVFEDNNEKKLKLKEILTKCDMCGNNDDKGIFVMNFNKDSSQSSSKYICRECYDKLNKNNYIIEEEDDESYTPESKIDSIDMSDIKNHIKRQQ